jgi:hypothetical protein
MVKKTRVAWMAILAGLALGSCPFGATTPARASTTSDQPAAILIWPKIVVDTGGQFGNPTDTLIQLTNTDKNDPKLAHCFYINANSHCANNPRAVCQTSADCPSLSGFEECRPDWTEIDFDVVLTKEQPIAWRASEGLRGSGVPISTAGTCNNPPIAGRPCTSDAQCGGIPSSCCGRGGDPTNPCPSPQSNIGTGIPPVPEDPFVGSLKCVQFTSTNPAVPDQTAGSNKLKGEDTIQSNPDLIAPDIEKYNAVGIKFKAAEADVPANQLHLDGTQYEACPMTLILNFFYEGGLADVGDLTLVPCGDDFLNQIPGKVTAQFVVFNEFEQRFSTSTLVDCFLETRLGNIDTPNPSRSIFSLNVGGTLQGMARIRGVGSASTGRGLVGLGRTFLGPASAAYNLYQIGTSAVPDVITLPRATLP